MTERLALPSKVTHQKHISAPMTERVVESDEEWGRCGKWILTSVDGDLSFVDRAWADLQPLIVDGPLILLKASTARLREEGGVVLCYTRPGKDEAKRAAKAIRRVVDYYRAPMFYKLNKVTDAGIARRYGHKAICLYMHTYLGKFYSRDSSFRWVLDEEDSKEVPLSSQFLRNNYSDRLGCDLLPSKSEKLTENVRVSDFQSENWTLFCSCSEDDDIYIPEVDRVWIVGWRLLNEGVFSGMSWRKRGDFAELRFYVSRGFQDVFSQLEHCDRIFEESALEGLIYYFRGDKARLHFKGMANDSDAKYYTKAEGKRKVYCMQTSDEIVVVEEGLKRREPVFDYFYTSKGELYGKAPFGSKFIFSKKVLFPSD